MREGKNDVLRAHRFGDEFHHGGGDRDLGQIDELQAVMLGEALDHLFGRGVAELDERVGQLGAGLLLNGPRFFEWSGAKNWRGRRRSVKSPCGLAMDGASEFVRSDGHVSRCMVVACSDVPALRQGARQAMGTYNGSVWQDARRKGKEKWCDSLRPKWIYCLAGSDVNAYNQTEDKCEWQSISDTTGRWLCVE